MLTKLVDHGIDINSKGGQWLLLILEEAQIAESSGKRFSVRGFMKSLKMSEGEIKAGYQAISTALMKANIEADVRKFIEDSLN